VDELFPSQAAYVYVNVNPTSLIDPTGLQGFPGLQLSPDRGLFDPRQCQQWGEGIFNKVNDTIQNLFPPCSNIVTKEQAVDCFAEVLARIDRTGLVDLFIKYKYGKCCGLKLRCNSHTKSVVDCLDRGCATHDSCLSGATDYVDPAKQYSCNAALCAALKNCDCKTSSAGRKACEEAKGSMTLFYCVLLPAILKCP